MTKLEEILADYFVDKGKMKSYLVDYNLEHIDIEYEDTIQNEGELPQKVKQAFVLYNPSLDFATKIVRANK